MTAPPEEDTAPPAGETAPDAAGAPTEEPAAAGGATRWVAPVPPGWRGHVVRAAGSRWPDRVVLALTWLVVAAGAGLRIRQWWFARSFWLDELLLLRAMSEQRFSELLEPLHLAQSAPPGWLLAEHVLIRVGPGERGARLLPLLFGIGAVVLTALLARTLLGPIAALAATVLVASSTQLIRYSAELKQYSADAFWLQLVLLVAVRLALRKGRPSRDRYVLAAVAGVAVWFSHATALGTGGVFVALGLQALVARRWRELLVLVACSVPFAAGLGLEYVTLLSANADNAELQSFWAQTFPPEGPLTWSIGWDWFTGRTRAVVANPLSWHYTQALLVLLAGGLAVLAARRPRALLVVVLPVVVIAAAGLAGSYPIANRLALWVIPLVALVVAAPLDLPLLAGRLPVPARWPAVAAAGLVAVLAAGQLVGMTSPWVRKDAAYASAPLQLEESRPALRLVGEQRRPGDLVLVDWGAARYAAAFYGPKLGVGNYLLLRNNRPSSACTPVWFGSVLRRSDRYQRVWLVTSHTPGGVRAVYERHLAQFGPEALRQEETGAAVVRFDRTPAIPPAPATKSHNCLRLVDPATAP